MKPDESDITGLFASQRMTQYSVPHYQRAQAWRARDHWEPLWADIRGKADSHFAGVVPNSHYLGAIVLAKRPKQGVRGVDKNLVIDGQQRLSTIQYILKALELLCLKYGYEDGVLSLRSELRNDGALMDSPTQAFKIWPTFRDRHAHELVMQVTAVEQLIEFFPQHYTKAQSLYVNAAHPRPLECLVFFNGVFESWLSDIEEPARIPEALEALRRAITNSLQLIVLWLSEGDDPSLVFESLNGRGEPLRPSDLVRNGIFWQAEQEVGATEITEDSPLFKEWATFDAPLWSETVTRGGKPLTRMEWLLLYGLQAETGQDIDTSRLFDAYQRWSGARTKTPMPASMQVNVLRKHAANLLRYDSADAVVPETPISRFGKTTSALDLTTVTPLALAIAANATLGDQTAMFDALSSYLVRREACGLTKKAYNVGFMAAVRELRKSGFTPKVLIKYLQSGDGSTSLWPDDRRFTYEIKTRPIYGSGGARQICRLLLSAAAARIGAGHASEVQWALDWKTLQVEHVLPQMWFTHWPLSDGSFANEAEALAASANMDGTTPEAVRNAEIHRRESLKNTLGNLTILNSTKNQELSNRAWGHKQDEIRSATQLRMNYDLVDLPIWDNIAIEQRGTELAEILIKAWPYPSLESE